MWKRKDLKRKAKVIVKKNYWTLVIACFILGICTGEFGMSTAAIEKNDESASPVNFQILLENQEMPELPNIANNNQTENNNQNQTVQAEESNQQTEVPTEQTEESQSNLQNNQEEQSNSKSYAEKIEDIRKNVDLHLNSAFKSNKYLYKISDAVTYLLIGKTDDQKVKGIILIIAAIVALLFILFVEEPLIVGGKRLFIKSRRYRNTSLKQIITVFKDNQLWNIVKTMLLKNVYVFLWLLTIIGGIIKSYQYAMVPYILAENPNIKPKDVLKLSKNMMKGQKWKTFVLGLSFFLWELLSVFTFGLLSVLYINPYKEATKVELYTTLKRNAIKNNIENAELLKLTRRKNRKEENPIENQ